MDDKEIRNILEHMSNPLLDHDPSICGHCLGRQIESEEAKRYLALKRELTEKDLIEVMTLSKENFQKTDLYRKVRKLLKDGKTLEEAREIMESLGWIEI